MSVQGTKHTGKLAFTVSVGDFQIVTDVKEQLGGENKGPDPHEYLETALAACTAITLQMYANRKGIPLVSSDVKITIVKEGPENEIRREIKLLGDLTEEQRKSLFVIAEKCPIHKLLSRGAHIESLLVD